jgi:hypothetical protein
MPSTCTQSRTPIEIVSGTVVAPSSAACPPNCGFTMKVNVSTTAQTASVVAAPATFCTTYPTICTIGIDVSAVLRAILPWRLVFCWRVAQAFDLAGIANTAGAPSFAFLAKGGSSERIRRARYRLRLCVQPIRCLLSLAPEYDEGGRIPPMLIGHRQLSFRFGFLSFLVGVLLILSSMSLSAQTVEIKLVDGRNGRPMVGASSYVNVWVGGERKEAIAIPLDDKGAARLQLTLNPREVNIPSSNNNGSIVVDHPVVKYDESFRINAPYVLCGPGGGSYSWLELKNFSTKEVLDHGYASANTCGKVTVSPQPGQVVLFVRPLTFWEKMKQ